MSLRNRVAVIGVGSTAAGRLPGNDAYDLGLMAFKNALKDCGLKPMQIDGLIVNRIPDYQRFAEIAGMDPRFALVTPGQGRMSGATIEVAVAIIEAGLAHTVALVTASPQATNMAASPILMAATASARGCPMA